jgi:putative nucleotidyltransferase with HDIG domain
MKIKDKNSVTSIIIFVLLFLVLSIVSTLKHFILPISISFSAKILSLTSTIVMLLLLLFVYASFCFITRKRLIQTPKNLAAIAFCISLTFSVCIFISKIDIFLMPIFLSSFLLAPLGKRKDTFMANMMSVLFVFVAVALERISAQQDILPLILLLAVGMFGGTLVSFTMSYEKKRLDFILKGIIICLASVALVAELSYLDTSFADISDSERIKSVVDAAKWSAIAIFSQLILVHIFQPFLEKIFGLLTNQRLTELIDHNAPLIRRLLSEAPGTFNHSLAVASFAEVCATAIGENPYMARAAAYYHDIGKLNSPQFFKENQSEGNPHDDMLPEVSVQIIRRHTQDGYDFSVENKLPEEIARVAIEHHGTMPITLFYQKAKELTDGDVDIKDYCYEGSLPTSKISAIIMICDAAEASVRAIDGADRAKTEQLVSSLIWQRLQAGQFDDCNITIKDLHIIQKTITEAVGGVYHKRIKYPEKKL